MLLNIFAVSSIITKNEIRVKYQTCEKSYLRLLVIWIYHHVASLCVILCKQVLFSPALLAELLAKKLF